VTKAEKFIKLVWILVRKTGGAQRIIGTYKGIRGNTRGSDYSKMGQNEHQSKS
jgi:hypothetical protein